MHPFQHIESFMEGLGGTWSVWKDTFDENTPLGIKTFTNVIAEQDAAAPRKLTLACHHDSKYFTSGTFIGWLQFLSSVAVQISSYLHVHTFNACLTHAILNSSKIFPHCRKIC